MPRRRLELRHGQTDWVSRRVVGGEADRGREQTRLVGTTAELDFAASNILARFVLPAACFGGAILPPVLAPHVGASFCMCLSLLRGRLLPVDDRLAAGA
jgi:hypothetical protein